MNEILLLGGTGFLGSLLVKNLEKTQPLKIMIHDSNFHTSAKKFRGDIMKKNSFYKEITNNETIINLVGQISPNDLSYINLNILGSLNLLNSCIDKKIDRIILISTIHVYGENWKRPSKENDLLVPKSQYGIVKMITEKIYQYFSDTYGINITILRLAGMYGPTKKTGFIAQLLKSLHDSTIHSNLFNNGRQFRDLLYVDDAVDGIVKAINVPQKGFQIFNISSGKRYSMEKLVSLIELISHKKISVKYTNIIPDERCIWADPLKAKKILKFQPKTSIEQGIKFAINHHMKNSKKNSE